MARRSRYTTRNVYWGAFVLEWFKHLQDARLSAADYRALFYLCENMLPSDNMARVKQKDIAENLNMDKGNVSKCLKKLCAIQFIIKAPDGYMINPHLFYIGGDPNHRQDLREIFDELLRTLKISPRFNMNEDEHTLEVHHDS